MVHLNRIYTKSGDTGETSLGNGERVPKTSLRIRAMGVVDELNAALGVCVAHPELGEVPKQRLLIIQNDLFDLGADLCLPEADELPTYPPLRVQASQVTRLEHWIDEGTAQLQPLNSFILPGGRMSAALLHSARTVCRRAEVETSALGEQDVINNQVLIYLNRLSDLLFVMARLENDLGKADVLWVPGEHR